MNRGPKAKTLADVMTRVYERLGPEPDDPEGCWEWPGSTSSRGYGTVQARALSSSPLYVHRLVFADRIDPTLTDQEEVLHRCDNPPCCRHLFKGSNLDNVRDCQAKGRFKIGGRTTGTWTKESNPHTARRRERAADQVPVVETQHEQHRSRR